MLISETLITAIQDQIGHERYNSNLYLYIAGYLKNKGLDNLAKHFESQHDEEIGHSLEFFNLLTDLNADVKIPAIEAIAPPLETILDIAKAYLRQEVLTTTKIDVIKKMAVEQNNPVVEEKMREMITKQQKEYEEATSFMDKAVLMSEWWQVALWDSSIG